VTGAATSLNVHDTVLISPDLRNDLRQNGVGVSAGDASAKTDDARRRNCVDRLQFQVLETGWKGRKLAVVGHVSIVISVDVEQGHAATQSIVT